MQIDTASQGVVEVTAS